MAAELSDGGEEFWLPDEFLDDDFFSEEEKAAVAARSESSDEESCSAGLSRHLAGLLGDDGDRDPPLKAEVTVGSPQSTLCGLPKSGQESPNGGVSQVSSPSSSPMEQKPADPWDMLYEPAGQVARMRFTNSIPVPNNPFGFRAQGGFAAPARKGSPPPPPVAPPATKVPAAAFYHPLAHLLTQRQIQVAQFLLLKQQVLLKMQRDRHLAVAAAWGARQNAAAKTAGCGVSAAPIDMSPAAWPPLQKQQHAPAPAVGGGDGGMRAVFLNPPGAKRERNGTGVFLPRPAGAPAELKKKSGCSTVLVPARVVQALNLNLGAQPCYPGGFVLDHDALISRSNAMLASQKRRAAPAVPSPAPALCRSS